MSPSADQGDRFPHLPALDGLRGVAVALVVAYHLAPSVVPGGFLGVDVFFVLSGFLITSLLLDEARVEGGVDLGRFYLRRVRRLAPALLLVLAAVSVYAAGWASSSEITRLREHSLWTLGYLANWRYIADGTTYTDLVVGQSPLRHTWSLAIEEQFYLVFPLVVLGVWAMAARRFAVLRRAVLVLALSGAAASALWMAVRWGDGSDPSRGFFGTDTRVHSLLVGVALGAVLLGRPPVRGRFAAVAGSVGVVIVLIAVALSHETSSGLQHGGFLGFALAVAAIITALNAAGWLRAGLSARPLVALGVISYGVYLWHWPIIVVLDEGRTGLDDPWLGALQLGLTLAIATASYRFVERPIRHGALGRRLGRPALAALPVGAIGLVFLLLVTTGQPGGSRPASAAGPTPSSVDAGDAVVPLPVGVVVVGDSVAHNLAGGTVGEFPQFEPWVEDQSPFDPAVVRLWSVAKPACSYLPGKVYGDGPTAADLSSFCGDWATDLDEALAAHPSTIVLATLANDAADRDVEGERVTLGTPAHDALLAEYLDEVRSIANGRGAELVLVALPPREGISATAYDENGRRQVLMREALRRYASTRQEVRVLDLFEQICPDGDCDHPAAGFQPEWRYDGMHYTAEGSRWVAAWLTRQLISADH